MAAKRTLAAAELAVRRAKPSPSYRCWRSVKKDLVAARIIPSYPSTQYAKDAGRELEAQYGFRKLPLRDPRMAPLGSILVYGGSGAGHVEFRSREGYVSDFVSPKPSPRPLLGIYVKGKA